MAEQWLNTHWGEICTLHYGKALKAYDTQPSAARVYGTNGAIGWHSEALTDGPGVIVGRKGAYRGVHYSAEPFWVIDTAYYLKPKAPMDLRWAYYALLDFDVNNIDDGSPIPSTTRDAFYFAPVRVPPCGEQRRIATLLDTLDAKIEHNRRVVATLEAVARALFQSWFVDFDPVHAKAEGRDPGLPPEIAALFPDRFGEDGLPEGWQSAPLSKLGTFLNGLALQKFQPADGEPFLPVIKITELRAGPTEKSGRARIDLPAEYVVDNGDHLFSWSGSLMHCRWTFGKGALNQHLFKVTPRQGVPGWLTYQAVEHHLSEFRAIAAGKAVTMGHIQRHHLDEATIPFPPPVVLGAFDNIFAPLAERSLAALLETRTLIINRDILLPKLISGELRIPDAAAAASAAA